MNQPDRIKQILTHALYQECLSKLTILEKNRLYCKHDLPHFLDTARLAYIEVLEKHLTYEREIVYAAALLHDIGRAENNERHDEASVGIAQKILPECGFTQAEILLITKAIANHRLNTQADALCQLIYNADKKSRNCFACSAQASCKWSKERQNQTIWR